MRFVHSMFCAPRTIKIECGTLESGSRTLVAHFVQTGILFAILIAIVCTSLSADATEPKVYAFDGFDEKLTLEWGPLREDETHVSLTKNPGKLTITTQRGTIGGDETRPGRIPTKNIYLIANPVADGGDFVVTTCIEGFKPWMKWQQAGLLIYDDDDNYLKNDMEWSGTAIRFKYIRESNQLRMIDTDKVIPSPRRTWIRITKRGNVYERAYSTDGTTFKSAGERGWGDGSPEWIGLMASSGPSDADEIDATFDFLEVRALTDDEKNDARYAARKKLQGAWEVVSSEFNGKPLEHSPLSEFVFDGGTVTFTEQAQTIAVDYTLDPSQEPNGFILSAISRQAKKPANGIYSLTDDQLRICLSLKPDAPAPTECKTQEGDSRLLLTLKRTGDE